MNKFWELRQSAQPKTVDLYIYSYVEPDSYNWWTGETVESETSANHFRDELAKIGELDYINIYINSLGGSVMEGVAIYNQLRRHKAYKTVYIDGFACSVASVIAMAGDKIIMPRNTNMMIHNAWSCVCGNAKELRKAADDLDVINESSRQAYLIKAGDKLAEEKLIEMMENETYLTAMQCVEYGLADEFAEKDADINLARQILQQAKQSAFKQMLGLDKIEIKLDELPPQQQIPEPQSQQLQNNTKSIEQMGKLFSAFLQSKTKNMEE